MLEQHEQHSPAAGRQAALAKGKDEAEKKNNNNPKPNTNPSPTPREWIRPKEVVARFGIGRTRLYALIREGKVDSVCLHSPGERQGTRLIKYASLTAYLESLLPAATAKAGEKGGAA